MNAAGKRVVLWAEDDPDDRLLFDMAWKEAGLSNPLVFVDDGYAAMAYLREEAAQRGSAMELPVLVLLDLNMPRMDGRRTLSALKADERLRRIPVIVVTTSASIKDINGSYESGANSYLRKPAAFDSLVAMLAELGRYWLGFVALPDGGA